MTAVPDRKGLHPAITFAETSGLDLVHQTWITSIKKCTSSDGF